MTRLYVLVEGPTEAEFTANVLGPHLGQRGISTFSSIVETSRDRHGAKRRGGGDWEKWRRDLLRLTGEQRGSEVRFTTMFDLYGLPKNFPELKEHCTVADTRRRVALLEAAMARDLGDDWRFIPYLQRHEFEALVLASLEELRRLLTKGEDHGLSPLQTLVASVAPEEINDGETTAPSKRLKIHVPSYLKTVHGPLAVEAAGLAKIRAACPRFNDWVTKLERLSTGTGP